MVAGADGNLYVYMLNVGQGDTTIIISPEGHVVIIDAMRPSKIKNLLNKLECNNEIEHIIITHPHKDHFSGCNSLVKSKKVLKATVAPFWHEFGMGPGTYRSLMGRFDDNGTNVTFLSGYSRWYPDGTMAPPVGDAKPVIDPNKPFIEMLGPTNGLVRMLEDAKTFNTNHLSIINRLSWKGFRMIISGDAQMENWSFFDHERMFEDKCQVLRASHHGSANGTQWERIDRLSPSQLIVSSDPDGAHDIPDLCGASIFARFDKASGQFAAITYDTGTIRLKVTPTGGRSLTMYHDGPNENIDLENGKALTELSNPTDWPKLVTERLHTL